MDEAITTQLYISAIIRIILPGLGQSSDKTSRLFFSDFSNRKHSLVTILSLPINPLSIKDLFDGCLLFYIRPLRKRKTEYLIFNIGNKGKT